MSEQGRRPGGTDPTGLVLFIAAAVVLVIVGVPWAAVQLAAVIDPSLAPPANPFTLALHLARGEFVWPRLATWILLGFAAVLLAIAVALGWWFVRAVRRASSVDAASARMARRRDLARLRGRRAREHAATLGVSDSSGLPVAVPISGGDPVVASFEDTSVDIWGPRTGKTTARAIPAVLAAPGPAVATTNKRDLVDATRDPRGEPDGAQVWVFDPQRIVGEEPTWWWDPLSYVTDEVRAANLADVFTTAGRDPLARTDAYFEPAARQLLAGLLLAAATARRPITDVYRWLTDPAEDEPASIVEPTYPLTAEEIRGYVNAPDKQRAGVYGTAQQVCGFLTNRHAIRWITRDGGSPSRPRFEPADFVRRPHDTLYSVSKEGRGTAGPLVTALTVAVTEAAEDYAMGCRAGRPPTPMVAVLDEAANVCRWRELPNQYSHYGSRGICVMTILQSWSQGVEVWGREGMRKLWSAANVRVYGGGVAEPDFLGELSQLIGEYDRSTWSTSTAAGAGRSTSHQTQRHRILDVSQLAALPRGRIVVFPSGTKPVLAKPLPWMDGPYAAAVKASIAAHDPGQHQRAATTTAEGSRP